MSAPVYLVAGGTLNRQAAIEVVRSFPCYSCRALAGRPCINTTGKREGKTVPYPHGARWNAFRFGPMREPEAQADKWPERFDW